MWFNTYNYYVNRHYVDYYLKVQRYNSKKDYFGLSVHVFISLLILLKFLSFRVQPSLDISRLRSVSNYRYLKVNFLVPENLL